MHHTMVLGLVLVQHLGHLEAPGPRSTPQASLDLVGRPLGHDLVLDLVHAADTVVDVLLVFPAVLEDVVQHAEQERDVGARADAHVLVGLGRGAREAWVDHDHLAAVFLGMQHVQHADTGCASAALEPMYIAHLLFCMSLYELVMAP